MSERLEKLVALGCDVAGAMDRFLEDEEFYFSCYDKFMEDPGFAQLKNELNDHDVKAAFDCAHALKGVIANLGLSSLYDRIVEIVEPLRAGTDEGLLVKYDELMKEREKYLLV